jgi:hypothetical protein
MRIAARAVSLLALGCSLAGAATADAASCGDANRTGTVTVTDGVLILRSAAQLETLCPRERCDMNVDGNISVTDGVLALRVAAEIQTSVACSAAQVDTIFGQVQKIGGLGGFAGPAGRARAAGGSTIPCPGGGFIEDDGVSLLTYVDCVDGDFVSTGTLQFEFVDDFNVNVFFDTSDFILSTGEVNETFGFLTYTFGDPVAVNGILTHQSSIVGEYTDQFQNVQLDENFFATSGRVDTVITDGQGFFTNVAAITSTLYSPSLARIFVSYADGDFDLFTLGDGLCEPCSSTCSNGSLQCLSCVGQCSNTTARCGIDFDALECSDGVFGPIGLCDPCGSSSQCNESQGLSCFECAENCTGSTPRCGSSLAFVECVDGVY